MMVVTGGEDGRITGWDMNSQDLKFQKSLDPDASNIKLVSSLDHDPNHDIIAASGNFKGLYIA